MDTETLTHLVGLHEALRQRSGLRTPGSEDVRRANGAGPAMADGRRRLSRERSSWWPGRPWTRVGTPVRARSHSRNLLDLAASAGFEIHSIDDMPLFARSVIDLDHRRVYIAQRDELRTRQARKAVLQTLAGFLLGHETDPDLDTFLRQRVETAYFAAAVLAPESAVVPKLRGGPDRHDLDVEDVKELFYVSYEMAAWRIANLATRHLGFPTHLIVSDRMGSVIKGLRQRRGPAPPRRPRWHRDPEDCAGDGARGSPSSHTSDSALITSTPTPRVAPSSAPPMSRPVASRRWPMTLGVRFGDAHWFRGRDTDEPGDLDLPRSRMLSDALRPSSPRSGRTR